MRKGNCVRCECGNLKELTAEACDTCAFLDGKSDTEKTIVFLLRELGPMTTLQVATELKAKHNTAYVRLRKMEEQGRLKQIPDTRPGRENDVVWGLVQG